MSNPVFNENVVGQTRILEGEPMTINGAVNKTFILLALLVIAACYTWFLAFSGYTDKAQMLTIGGGIVGMVLAFVVIFTRKAMHVLTPLYAVCEGFFIGGISAPRPKRTSKELLSICPALTCSITAQQALSQIS